MQRLTELPPLANADILTLMAAYYKEPLMIRLGAVLGCSDSASACLKTGRAWLYKKLLKRGVEEVENCHAYAGRPISCLQYGNIRHDGHIFYAVYGPTDVLLLSMTHAYEARLPVSDSKYISLASAVNAPLFSDALLTDKYGIIYIPGEDSIYYHVLSHKKELSVLGSLGHIHDQVVEVVKAEISEYLIKPHKAFPALSS
ncbi:MAG: hypothetical protein ACP5I3_11000 [Thermoproteus sp.]